MSGVPHTLLGMGNIIFDTATAFNGFIADRENSLSWLFEVEGGEAPEEGLYPAGATVQVMGSTTYEWVCAQEGLLAQPERWSELYGTTPVFVFTTRALKAPRGADVRFVSGDVSAVLPEIREAAAGGDVWIVGGGDLAGQLLDAGALDRIALSLAPVALDGGAPLFTRRIDSSRLRLVEARQVGQFARLVYSVTGPSGRTETPTASVEAQVR